MSNVRCCGIFYEYQSPLLHLSFFSSFITPFLFSLLKLFMPPPLPSYFLSIFCFYLITFPFFSPSFSSPPFLPLSLYIVFIILSFPNLSSPLFFSVLPSPLSSALISMNIHSLHLSVFLSFSPSVFISCPHFTSPLHFYLFFHFFLVLSQVCLFSPLDPVLCSLPAPQTRLTFTQVLITVDMSL